MFDKVYIEIRGNFKKGLLFKNEGYIMMTIKTWVKGNPHTYRDAN